MKLERFKTRKVQKIEVGEKPPIPSQFILIRNGAESRLNVGELLPNLPFAPHVDSYRTDDTSRFEVKIMEVVETVITFSGVVTADGIRLEFCRAESDGQGISISRHDWKGSFTKDERGRKYGLSVGSFTYGHRIRGSELYMTPDQSELRGPGWTIVHKPQSGGPEEN